MKSYIIFAISLISGIVFTALVWAEYEGFEQMALALLLAIFLQSFLQHLTSDKDD